MTELFGFAFILITFMMAKKVMERKLHLFTGGGGGGSISDKVSKQLEFYLYYIIVRIICVSVCVCVCIIYSSNYLIIGKSPRPGVLPGTEHRFGSSQ